MATDIDFGVCGYFIKDATAHTNSEFIAAQVMDVNDSGPDDTVSLVVFEPGGTSIPYGPSPSGDWTADVTPVSTVINPSGYYFVVTGNITNAQLTANIGVATAAASSDAAGGNNTPQALISVIPDQFSYDNTLHLWHERFGNEIIEFLFDAPVETARYKIMVKDVNGAGGAMTAQVFKATRTVAPTAPTWVSIGSGLATNADGTVQEFDISLTPTNGLSRHRIRILTGTINGGIGIADQYQVLQIYRVI